MRNIVAAPLHRRLVAVAAARRRGEKRRCRRLCGNGGFTLVEMVFTLLILGILLAAVGGVFVSSSHLHGETNRRAALQMNARLGIGVISQELRHAGCDPAEIGISGIVRANADTLRIQADLDGDGVIETAEPSEDVSYCFDPVSETLFRDPGTGPQVLVPNVSNLTINYLDADNNPLGPLPLTPELTARVRSIAISITTRTDQGEEFTLDTIIALRNA